MHLVVGEQGVQRQAKLLGRQFFGDGARQPRPLRIALLLVRWQRIVYLRLYATLRHVVLQSIALGRHKGKYMEYMAAEIGHSGHLHPGVIDAVYIHLCNGAATLVIAIETTQFHSQHCCLKFIHATIYTHMLVDIFL